MESLPTYVAPDELRDWATGVLSRIGMREDDAVCLADVLVSTDIRGVSTHGVILLTRIVGAIESGEMNRLPEPRVVSQAPAVLHVDGDNGPGQLVARYSMDHAMQVAQSAGVGVVIASNTNHFGAASSYTEQAAHAGLWGIALSNSRALVAAPGHTIPFLGTNPISLSAVGENGQPFVVDFSTAASSRGKIRAVARAGSLLPEGVAVDKHGEPTTDPNEALNGFVLPLGGERGIALGLFVELLAGLGADNLSSEVPEPEDRWGGLGLGQLFIAMNPATFGDPKGIAHRVSRLQASTRLAAGRAPGDRREQARLRSLEHGIELSHQVADQLAALGRRVGLDFPVRGA